MLRHTQISVNGKQHHFTQADSVKELTAAAFAVIESGDKETRSAHERPSFIGREFADAKAAFDAATQPWDEGIKQVADLTADLRKTVKLPKPVSLKRQKVWSIEDGDEIDFDRLRAGDAFYRTTKKQNSVKTKQVTIFIDTAAAARRQAVTLQWRGVAAITIARLLEDAGYRVSIVAYDSADSGFTSGMGRSLAITLKSMKDRLNIGTVASACSGWFFRTVGFESYNLIEGEHPSGGLGYHNEDVDDLLSVMEPNKDARLNISGVWDKEAAADLIKDVIKRLNAEAENKLVSA